MHWKYIGLKIPNEIRKTKSSLLETGKFIETKVSARNCRVLTFNNITYYISPPEIHAITTGASYTLQNSVVSLG